MDTFSIITTALAATENDPDKVGLDASTIETGRILAAVQTVVDALTPPDGGRYIVGFADISTAGTSLGERRITVSSKPLRDPRLSLIEKAVVIATFAAHEIGHTLVTRPRGPIVREHNAHTGFHAVANMADDIILEPFMADRYPILKDAFEFTGLWVLRTTTPELPKVLKMRRSMTTPERFNVLLSATRYGDIPEIVWSDGVTLAERDWARAWSARLIALRLTDGPAFLALCDEAWDRVRSESDEEPGDEPEPEPEQGGAEGEPEESESDEGDDDEGEGQGSGDDEGDDESEGDESEGEGQPGESDGDDEDGDGAEGESEDGEGEAGDEPGESDGSEGDESDGTTESGESMDGASESDEEGEGQGGEKHPDEQPDAVDWDEESEDAESEASDEGHQSGTPGEDGVGGGGNAEQDTAAPLRDEGDFRKDEVEQGMHDQSEPDPRDYYRDHTTEEAVRTYANTTVTSFGRHGSLPTEWS